MTKPVVKCTPKLPKSVAREYSLNTFLNALNETVAKAVFYSDRFKPVVNDEGWCDLRADLFPQEVIIIPAQTFAVIDCGFDIKTPDGFELYFRPLNDSKFMLTDASNRDYKQRLVRVNVVNYSTSSVCIRTGDRIGEMCVRPINNIPILIEEA